MDKYTKAVLTVIAVCLVLQTGRQFLWVDSEDYVMKVRICDGTKYLWDCVNIEKGTMSVSQ